MTIDPDQRSKYQKQLTHALKAMEDSCICSCEADFASDRKILGPLLVFIRKAARRLFMQSYIQPICLRQTLYNKASLEMITELLSRCEALEQENASLRGSSGLESRSLTDICSSPITVMKDQVVQEESFPSSAWVENIMSEIKQNISGTKESKP